MSDKKKEKSKEVISFIICLIVLLCIGYFTGFLEGFAPSDFYNAYRKLTANLDSKANSSKDKINLFETNRDKKAVQKYAGYQPNIIPEAVIRGYKASNIWTNIFASSTKVVFYTYSNSENDIKFNDTVFEYLTSREMVDEYILQAYTEKSFSNAALGTPGPSKICNSFEECNAVRQKASDYSLLSEFLKRCGQTMCVINNDKREYIRLRTKNSQDATSMLQSLKGW